MEEQINTIKFLKTSLLTNLYNIAGNSYETAFCDRVVAMTTGRFFSHLNKIKDHLTQYKSIVINDFVTTNDLSLLLGKRYFDSKQILRSLQQVLVNELLVLLQHEFGKNTNAYVEFSEGIIIINQL
ncbi:MAG: hypothetical protein JWN78_2026 [Bacteroidota bacterium]|nr:hypothetical protein [Bacteroidota bacterium]